MSRDYIILGYGRNGRVKNDEPGKTELSFFPGNPVQSPGDSKSSENYMTKTITLPVQVIEINGQFYQVVCNGHPDANELARVVEMYKPEPVTY